MPAKVFKTPVGTSKPTIRKHLNADALIALLGDEFNKVKDHRAANSAISIRDALMSGFALFSLKDPSLLAFDERRQSGDANLHRIYGIEKIPCDTRLREILDPLDPSALRRPFKRVFARIQRGKALEQLTFLNGHYLISGDGTGFFYSKKLSNESCLTKTSKKDGTAFHQSFYGAALVHPQYREVIPFPPEFISKKDGQSKNDCEREASKRFLAKFRREHPHLPVIMIEDALASNGPHIRALQANNMRFILGVKESDHEYLFEKTFQRERAGHYTEFTIPDAQDPNKKQVLYFVNGLPLNKANQDIEINLLDYWEVTTDRNGRETKRKHFSWVTDLHLTKNNAFDIMRAGRARWKVENETFNTLKNQGYHLEHNFGLGKENLSRVFVSLMMLAFLVDQTQQLCCGLYRAACWKYSAKRTFFETTRGYFRILEVEKLTDIFRAIAFGHQFKSLQWDST